MTSFERETASATQDRIAGESVDSQQPASCANYRNGVECVLNRASVWRTK